MKTSNFGEHTWRNMNALITREQIENGRVLDPHIAFEMVSELDHYQAHVVFVCRIEKKQVQHPNFGRHTLAGMEYLKKMYGVNDLQAFNEVKELNEVQIKGKLFFELSNDQVVETPNFGEHTLKAMRILMVADSDITTYQEAFEKVKGLNIHQAEGISEYLLIREQVKDIFYSEKVLKIMKHLHKQMLYAEGANLYDFAIKLPEYIARGILEYELTLKELGIGIFEDKFKIKKPKDKNFSGKTIDAIESIISQEPQMSFQKAYGIAIKLNSHQIRGIVDYGLTYDQ